MNIWTVQLFDQNIDEEWVSVEADTLVEAARKVYDEWAGTGWETAVVFSGGEVTEVALQVRRGKDG